MTTMAASQYFKAAATKWGPGKVHEAVNTWLVDGGWMAACQYDQRNGTEHPWVGEMLLPGEGEIDCKTCLAKYERTYPIRANFDAVLLCPVCSFEYTHFDGAAYADQSVHITGSCENGHRFIIKLDQYKGHTRMSAGYLGRVPEDGA